jgi:hypothetical protein
VAQVQGAPFRMPPRRSSLANLGAHARPKNAPPRGLGMRAAAADEDSRDLAEVSVVEFDDHSCSEGERDDSGSEFEGGEDGDDRTQTTLDMHWSQKAAQQRDAPPMCKFHRFRSALGMWRASHIARCSLGARRRPRACQRKLS